MHADAIAHLTSVDPVMAGIISRAGPCELKPDPRRSPYQSLIQAVAHQQLNGKAAQTILDRFLKLFPRRRFPSPEDVDAMDPLKIQACGFSRAKTSYIKDITRKTLDGVVPKRAAIEKLEDEAIIECLTQVKGIGRWSAEMFLMFGLARPDVLPVHDFGVRRGYFIAYRKRSMPTPSQLEQFGTRWRPHRSVAAWYLWRAADMSKS